MKIKVSYHAKERARSRLGMTPKELKKAALLSLEEGIDALADETLRPLVLRKAIRNDSFMYLYQGAVFIFKEDTLVTVYPVSWLALHGDEPNLG